MAKIKLFQSDAENEFNTWFESIKDKLGEDIAADERALRDRIDALAEEQAKCAHSVDPVSYTHLDVYKRQWCTCRPY